MAASDEQEQSVGWLCSGRLRSRNSFSTGSHSNRASAFHKVGRAANAPPAALHPTSTEVVNMPSALPVSTSCTWNSE